MKKSKTFILSLLAVLALGACNKSPSGPTDSLSYDSEGGVIFDNVKLKVWSIIGDPDQQYLNVVNRAFNDYYNGQIEAQVTAVSTNVFYTSLANTITSDPESAPDVILYHSERLTSMINNKIIVPFDDYFDLANTEFDKDDYIDGVIEECIDKTTNKLYGVPLDVHAGVWFVRSDILEKNGLKKPTNLQEFNQVCNDLIKLNNEGKLYHRAMNKNKPAAADWVQTKIEDFYPVSMYSADNIESGWIPQTAVFQNGGSLVDADGKPTWNTEGLKSIMQMFRDYQTGENLEGPFVAPNTTSETIWSNLASANAVFTFEGPWWCEDRLDEYNEVLGSATGGDDELKTYQPLDILSMESLYALDPSKEYANTMYGVGHCFSITSTCNSNIKRAAAAIYAKYMTENASDYMRGGHLPASKAILESPRYLNSSFYQAYLKEFGDPNNFKMLGRTPYYEEVYVKLKRVYMDVLSPLYASETIENIINTRYNEAIDEINASIDL
ncbi:MAG: ABC transporter substrate-binding protein [Bacilli bacterium]